MKCTSCNKKVRKGFSYCPTCGNDLNPQSPIEVVSPSPNVEKTFDCSCGESNCSCNNQPIPSQQDEFIQTSVKMRRKSLLYLFAFSSVLIFFSFSIALILNKLSVLETKNNDFQSFFYSYVNDSSPVFIDGLKDGHLSFDKHKMYNENNKTYVEFYLTSYGNPTFNGINIFNLNSNKAELYSFTSSLTSDLWFEHIDSRHYNQLKEYKISIFIDGELHSYSKNKS